MSRSHWIASLAALPLVAAGMVGCAGEPEVTALLGYSRVDLEEGRAGLEPIIDDRGGGRFSVGIEGPIAESDNGSGFRIGGRLVTSYYRQPLGGRFVADEPLLTIDEFVGLSVVSPQFVASYLAVAGYREEGAFFVEPGVGVGPSIGTLSFGSELQFGDRPVGTDVNDTETQVGFGVNPFLRLGYAAERFRIGAEGGYQLNTFGFDDALGDEPKEWYVGLFFGVRLGP